MRKLKAHVAYVDRIVPYFKVTFGGVRFDGGTFYFYIELSRGSLSKKFALAPSKGRHVYFESLKRLLLNYSDACYLVNSFGGPFDEVARWLIISYLTESST